MADALAELLREAYATGWAASGGPMTDRVRAGCIAAVEIGLQQPDGDHLIEATLHLGHLEGVWARIFERRLKLHDDNETAILDAWRPIAADLDVDTLIRQANRPTEAIDLSTARVADIASRVTSMMRTVVHNVSWKTLRKIVVTAIENARAEGRVGALALGADALGNVGFDFELAFNDAYAAIENAPDLLTEADAWLKKALGDQGNAVGKKLADLMRDEASIDEQVAAITGMLADGSPVRLVIDQLTSRGMSQGALDLYKSEGVDKVDFITAGDDRVCFPKNTPVLTPVGSVAIDTVRVGDLVITPLGARRVVRVGSRPYAAGMVVVEAGGVAVAATSDHPFWTPSGWVEAQHLRPGDLLKTADDELVEIKRLIDLDLAETDGRPAVTGEICVASAIALDATSVPVGSVDLQGRVHRCGGEVDRPPADLELLLEVDAKPLQRLPELRLQPVLADIPALTGVRAEPADRDECRHGTLRLSTLDADAVSGRATAHLGAVMPVEPLLGAKSLPASFAVNVLRRACPAGERAAVITVGSRALGDDECSTADRADLLDRICPAEVVALASTEAPIWIASGPGIELDPASTAVPGNESALAQPVAPPRAEHSQKVHLSASHEGLTALLACVVEGHEVDRLDVLVAGCIEVYDIEVEGAHSFYANGLLVHNCNSPCEEAEENSPYLLADCPTPGLHPLCRCCVAAVDPLSLSAVQPYLIDDDGE